MVENIAGDMEESASCAAARLAPVLANLDPCDAVAIIRELHRLERAAWPPKRRAAERLWWRDFHVRAALGYLGDGALLSRALSLAKILRRRACSQLPPREPLEHVADRILQFSKDEPINHRQIQNIAGGSRR